MCVLQGVPVSAQSCRHVSLHEHHSMDLMSTYGISVPRGELATTAEQARDITQRLGMHVHVHLHVYIVHTCTCRYTYIYMYMYMCTVT